MAQQSHSRYVAQSPFRDSTDEYASLPLLAPSVVSLRYGRFCKLAGMSKNVHSALVPRTQRSAISAFTRVFDALWHLRSGALQSRGRTRHRSVMAGSSPTGFTHLPAVLASPTPPSS